MIAVLAMPEQKCLLTIIHVFAHCFLKQAGKMGLDALGERQEGARLPQFVGLDLLKLCKVTAYVMNNAQTLPASRTTAPLSPAGRQSSSRHIPFVLEDAAPRSPLIPEIAEVLT